MQLSFLEIELTINEPSKSDLFPLFLNHITSVTNCSIILNNLYPATLVKSFQYI